MAKLILTADVANLGGPGDVVEVKDGYARNFLLPRNLAIAATRGAEKQVRTIRRTQQARRIRDLDHAKEIKNQLATIGAVPMTAKAAPGSQRLFGSVSEGDIAAALKAAGGPLLDKRVLSTEDHIKTVGKHIVNARLHPDVTASFTVEVAPAQ
jgi:large subunit ribosomal protein L9